MINKKLYIDVTCKECKTVFPKIKIDVKRWKTGLCIKCSTARALKIINSRDNTGQNNPRWVPPIKCIDCSKEIKTSGERRFTQQRCADCYMNYLKNNKPYNYIGASVCECGSKKAWHANKCRKCAYPDAGLPNCIICGNTLSTYKGSNKSNTGICRSCYRGDKCHLWKPSITMEDRERDRVRFYNPLHAEWRKKVFKRDGYDCQKCGQHGQKLCAHHIESYSKNKEKRYDINNGVTLCRSCHVVFHNKYGWFDSNRKDLNEFLTIPSFISHSFGHLNAAV